MAEEWNPFNEMKKGRGLFDEWFFGSPFSERRTDSRRPLTDISDEGDKLEIITELPGVKKDDIEINVEEDSIQIKTKSKSKTEEKKENYYFHERSYSSFNRVLPLPVKVIPDKAEAEFKNGILSVTIPKKEPTKKKKGVKVRVK